jgi:hypothetical protein
LNEFVAVDHELGICPRAQFVQVHPLALAFQVHSLWVKPIQYPVQAVSERQHKSEQRSDPYQLREPLLCIAIRPAEAGKQSRRK